MTTAIAPKKTYHGVHDWIMEEHIRNEKGELIEFQNHRFLIDIYDDLAPNLVVMKAAQVGLTTCEMLKNHFDAKQYNLDIIYTLPTDADVRVMVGGKTNRIIANNQCMLDDVADKDSVESKKVGGSMIYFRGTFTKKSAMMTPADRLVHDEKDASKLDIIADYQARLQHSAWKQTHTFSHPSLPETGIHLDWQKSDQKYWFVTCPHCDKRQYLSWDTEDPKKMSIDLETKQFVCKKCHEVLEDWVRVCGEWVAKYPERSKTYSGYWVPLLICPWMSAADIIEKYQNPETTPEFFYTKILGLPFADAKSKLLREYFMQNLTGTHWAPNADERIVIGIDTGLRIDYVMGNSKGLFFHGDCNDYDELDGQMKRWPKAIAVVDQGGDLIGSRKFYERWPGRVFLCSLAGDRKTKELVKWGKGDEFGAVTADRNRMIQLVIDEFSNKRIKVHGTENDWYEYWLDWNNLSKMKILDPDSKQVKSYKWVRAGRDHRALATVFWRVGMRRFSGVGMIVAPTIEPTPNSYMVNPDSTASFNPEETFAKSLELSLDALEETEGDWRNI